MASRLSRAGKINKYFWIVLVIAVGGIGAGYWTLDSNGAEAQLSRRRNFYLRVLDGQGDLTKARRRQLLAARSSTALEEAMASNWPLRSENPAKAN